MYYDDDDDDETDDDDFYADDFLDEEDSDMIIDISSETNSSSQESHSTNSENEEMEHENTPENGPPPVNDQINQAANTPTTEQPSSLNDETAAIIKDDEKAETSAISSTQVDAENCCIICTEMWTNSEEHHIVSLKCGHLFGKSCIENWLLPSRGYNRCPQCNKPAKKRDIHKIFARCVKPLDTWERDEAFAKVKVWESKVITLESELEKSKSCCKALIKENDDLRYQIMNNALKSSKPSSTIINANIHQQIAGKSGKFRISHSKDYWNREGGYRFHCYSRIIEAMAISVPNSDQNHPILAKYGVKLVPLTSERASERPDLIFIHNKPMKDMAINQYDGTITTVSQDKTLKITSLIGKQVTASINLTNEPWSIHLPAGRPNLLYVGLRNGDVMLYDKRNTSRDVMHLTSTTKTPVVSLSTVEFKDQRNQKNAALLSVQLDTCSVYQFANQSDPATGDYSVSKLGIEGKFTSSYFDSKSGYALLSCRPSLKHEKVTHYVRICSFLERHFSHNFLSFI